MIADEFLAVGMPPASFLKVLSRMASVAMWMICYKYFTLLRVRFLLTTAARLSLYETISVRKFTVCPAYSGLETIRAMLFPLHA